MPSPAESKSLKQVNVFISSPADVSDERNAVRNAVITVNTLVAEKQGVLLKATGWEDANGKAERTQDLINELVKSAHIYIGILNKRFGRPTEYAESGTEEEYNIVTERWHNEDPKPRILFYFRRLSEEDECAEPESQLGKVLKFREQIAKTVLYQKFNSATELRKMVEIALADWVHSESANLSGTNQEGVHPDVFPYLDMLAEFVKSGELTKVVLADRCNLTASATDEAVQMLERSDLIKASKHGLSLSMSLGPFLAIAQHLLGNTHYKTLLQSAYFKDMLHTSLVSHVQSRFHCSLTPEMCNGLQILMRLSRSAAEYLLFGSTEYFENVTQRYGDPNKALALNAKNVMHRALLRYINDCAEGTVLHQLDDKMVKNQMIKVRLTAATTDGQLLADIHSENNLMLYKATDKDLLQGEQVVVPVSPPEGTTH